MDALDTEKALDQIYTQITEDGPTGKYFCERYRTDCPRSNKEEDFAPHSDNCIACPHFKVYWHKGKTPPCPSPASEMCKCVRDFQEVFVRNHSRNGIWKLGYKNMGDELWQMCHIMTCPKCAKQFCVGREIRSLTLNERLRAVYQHLSAFRAFTGLCWASAQQNFMELFHEEDRSVVQNWIALPENQSMWRMYWEGGKQE